MTSLAATHSSYIIQRNPEKFGGRQADFLEREGSAVTSACTLIRECVDKEKDITACFYKVLRGLARARKQAAISHKSANSDFFGTRRDDEADCKEICHGKSLILLTFLNGDYSEFHTKMFTSLTSIINRLPHTNEKFLKTTYSTDSIALGRLNRFTLEVLTPKKVSSLLISPTLDELNKAVENFESTTIIDFQTNARLLATLKERNSELYKRLKTSLQISQYLLHYPSIKDIPGVINYLVTLEQKPSLNCFYLLATNRIEIEGKLFALSQYFTRIYCDLNSSTAPVKLGSPIMVIHQDTFLIGKTLENISKVFRDCITSRIDKIGLGELQTKIGLLRYEFSHCMPFLRGSAAIGEWLEKAIYRFHGFKPTHSSRTIGDCEALTALDLEKFLTVYPTTITLDPIVS